jgi:hypothetical protein
MLAKRLTKILLYWSLLIVVAALLGKATVASDNGAAVADFLNIGVGARAAAFGGAYCSVADDATASYWNPARLVFVDRTQVAFCHYAWYQDLAYDNLAVAYSVSDRLTIAGNASYLSYGTIEGYDQYDNPTGQVASTYDLSAGLSAGYRLTENLACGLTGKLIVLSLAGRGASALASDLGLSYRLNQFDFGLSVVNLGQKITFDRASEDLPTGIRAGVSARSFGSRLLASLEAESRFHGNFSIKNGFEFRHLERYFLRAGYAFCPGEEDYEFGHSLSFGVGAILGPARFDYTFSPQEKYSSENLHMFSLILGF